MLFRKQMRTDVFAKCMRAALFLMLLYGISTAFYGLIPTGLPLNSLFMGLLLMDVVIVYFATLTHIDALLGLCVLFWGVWTVAFSEDFATNIGDYLNVSAAMLIAWKIISPSVLPQLLSAVKKYSDLIRKYVIFFAILVAFELFIPSCYGAKSSWGSESYFFGFSQSYHVWASCLCLFLVLVLVNCMNRRITVIDVFCLCSFSLAILQTGARVFVLPLGVLIFLFLKNHVSRSRWKLFIVPVFFIGVVYVVLNTNMLAKFDFLSVAGSMNHDYDAADTFSSGRTILWTRYIESFLALPLPEKLFGSGFDFIYTISDHSGHNDFLHALLGIGLCGTLVYSLSFLKMKNIFKAVGLAGTLRRLCVAILLVYFYFPFFMNGMYGYLHYLLSVVFLALYLYEINVDGCRVRHEEGLSE